MKNFILSLHTKYFTFFVLIVLFGWATILPAQSNQPLRSVSEWIDQYKMHNSEVAANSMIKDYEKLKNIKVSKTEMELMLFEHFTIDEITNFRKTQMDEPKEAPNLAKFLLDSKAELGQYRKGQKAHPDLAYNLPTSRFEKLKEVKNRKKKYSKNLLTCTGDVFLESQADVNAFGAMGCTEVDGNLWIGEDFGADPITTLAPLSGITSVTGDIDISFSSGSLVSLDGLETISSVEGYLAVYFMPSLVNVNGLSGITSVGTIIYFDSNPLLENLDGLVNITSSGVDPGFGVSDLTIIFNPSLVNCCGIGPLLTSDLPDFINIFGNGAGCNSIIEIGFNCGFITECSSPLLAQYIQVTNQAQLDFLGSLECKSFTGDLTIGPSTDIVSLDALAGLNSIDGTLRIESNPALVNCCGIVPLISKNLPGQVFVNDNGAGCSSLYDIGVSCGANLGCKSPFLSNLTFTVTSQVELDELLSDGCKDIPGNLIIGPSSDITNLDALDKLKTIGGDLTIQGNSVLPNIDGFSKLKEIGGFLWINGNNILQNLNGFSKVKALGVPKRAGFIAIGGNPELTNIDGMSNVNIIDGTINIGGNPKLANIDGLTGLSFLKKTNPGSLSSFGLNISNNASLANIDGCQNMNTIGWLSLVSLPSLTNVDGLSGLVRLEQVGRFVFNIVNNSSLTNLDGCSNLSEVSSPDLSINILGNPVLIKCCGIFPLLNSESFFNVDISNNGAGCTEADILIDGPCPEPVFITSKKSMIDNRNANEFHGFSVYPNPSSEEITIEIKASSTGPVNLKIVDLQGKILWQKSIDDTGLVNEIRIGQSNSTSLHPGMYFVTMTSGGELFTKKVIME